MKRVLVAGLQHESNSFNPIVTGEKDLSSTVYNNERMYAALTAPKELVVIKDCPHTFDSDQNRKDLCEALDRWLKTKV